MTAKDILLRWLETCIARKGRAVRFRSSQLQTNVPSWGKKVYDEQYAPNNFLRRFRSIKPKSADLREHGIDKITEVPSDHSESIWQAHPMSGYLHKDYQARSTASTAITSGTQETPSRSRR